MHTSLIAPIFLALATLGIPIIAKLVLDFANRKVPKRLRPAAALVAGAAVGAGAHALGMPADQAVALAGLTGPGAVVAHELGEALTGRRGKPADRPGERKK